MGTSLVSDADPKAIKNVMANRKLAVPLDAIVGPLSTKRENSHVSRLDAIQKDEAILDDGPQTSAMLEKLVQDAKTVLWNGPLGNYENGYTDATRALVLAVAKSNAFSIIGGGDTEAAIEELNVREHFSFISTGGGAMLDFLAKGTLPGLQALG